MTLSAAYDAAKTAAQAGDAMTLSAAYDAAKTAATATNLAAAKTVVDATKVVVDAVKVVTDKYATMIVVDGAVYVLTANALKNGPSGGSSAARPEMEE
jgi:hypothetical protein